ncbi:MAG: S4 domain-containing protein [Gammaproteobacteria bacterium]|nr:S4 domain-containing protein [Gammaproteobacteria bacterium]
MEKVRLDKWLWAARFFRTRAKAKEAIDGGKVHVGGARGKPGRELQVGEELKIRQGQSEKVVVVKALSDQRRGAPEAQLLFEETPESRERREREAAQRKAVGARILAEGKPDKRERRQAQVFKRRPS